MLDINRKFLNHDYFTDIIGFPGEQKGKIGGDLFVSVDRIRENSKLLGLRFVDELHRVMIHRLLHFCGYSDKTRKAQKEMRSLEEHYLGMRSLKMLVDYKQS